jgi:nucleoside-diphosphate-sugar epimerase
MRILITGALGHIGSKLIRKIGNAGTISEIILIDNMSTQRYCSLFELPKDKKYSFISDDVRNIRNHIDVIGKIDYVVHLAAITDAESSIGREQEVTNNNLESTRAVSLFCCEMGIPLIFPSSTSVYGPQSAEVDENSTELKPQSPYADCKLLEEELIESLSSDGLKYCILRLGTIFGVSPGMRFHTAVNKFCWQSSVNQPITVWETAYDQLRPYLDLDDAINCIEHIILNNLHNNGVYNVVTNNYSVRNVVDAIKSLNSNVTITFTKSRIMNQLSYKVLSEKIKNTGFKFNGSLQLGIAETLELLGTKVSRRA